MTDSSSRKAVFQGTGLNIGAHLLLVAAAWWLVSSSSALRQGEWAGWSTTAWIAAAVAVPILHQGWVWLWWRTQYYLGTPERLLGLGPAFRIYRVGFSLFMFLRGFTVIAVGVANAGTLPISRALSFGLAVALSLPVLWLFYSIQRYFGFVHAMGADHFFEEHRNRGVCREGIFRYLPNAMYTVGFFVAWVIGLVFRSQAVLLIAAFAHASIWVHYFALERPDMREIYGADSQ